MPTIPKEVKLRTIDNTEESAQDKLILTETEDNQFQRPCKGLSIWIIAKELSKLVS